MACDFGAEGLCLIFLQTLHMKSNFVTFVPCNWFVIFFSNLDKYFMKNVNISYQQLLEDLQCYFCQFLPRYKIGMEIDICDCIDLIITHFNSLKVPSSPLVTLKASVWVTKFKCCNSVWWKYLFNTLFRFGMARNLAWLTLTHLVLKLRWIVWSPSITQILQFGTLADLAKTLTPLEIF